MQVVFEHYVYASSGFGSAGREIAFAMEDIGVDIKLKVLGSKSSLLNKSVVERLRRMEEKQLKKDRLLVSLKSDCNRDGFQKAITCTMFETTQAPKMYVDGCNQCDGLIVPCEMNRQAFRDGGVKVPIFVAHYGVDSTLYRPHGPSRELGKNDDDFVFLSVFGWSDRKGPEILIRAFLNEFNSDEKVRLVLKAHSWRIDEFPTDWYESTVRQVKKSKLPKINTFAEDLSPEEMAMLYRGADCFVLPTRGEAIGLPYLESMATGLPVIATGWSGQTEYLGPKSGYLIPYKLVHAHPVWFTDLYQPDQLWADPDEGALQSLMRRVYTMRDEAKRKGKHGRRVAKEWTWRRTSEEFVEAIESVVGTPIR